MGCMSAREVSFHFGSAPVEYHMRAEHWFRSQTVTLTHWPDGSDDDPWGHDECIFHKGTVHTLLFTTIAHKKIIPLSSG